MVPPERLYLGGHGEPGGARAWCAPEECGRQGFVDVHVFTNLVNTKFLIQSCVWMHSASIVLLLGQGGGNPVSSKHCLPGCC